MAEQTLVEAGLLLPHAHAAFSPGGLVFAADEVLFVGESGEAERRFPRAQLVNARELILIPGLVNAHTHLCYTCKLGRFPFFGSFPLWLFALGTYATARSEARWHADTRAGIRLSLAAGTVAVGDICSRWDAVPLLDQSPLGGVAFGEVLGMGPQRVASAHERLAQALPRPEGGRISFGLSPHTPYTTDQGLYRACADVARERGLRLATHLAETRAEEQFVRHDRGVLAHVARRLSEGEYLSQPTGGSPVEYMADLGVLGPDVILAHLNYPSPDDIRLVADSGAHVAFCPGSHRFFRHEPHPVEDLLAASVNVCLGTDSLASNVSLSVLREMRLLREAHQAISPAQALHMGTMAGAEALGIADRYGSLAAGKSASFVAVRPAVPVGEATTPDEAAAALLAKNSTVELVIAAGSVCFDRDATGPCASPEVNQA